MPLKQYLLMSNVIPDTTLTRKMDKLLKDVATKKVVVKSMSGCSCFACSQLL
jgi:hypothetical protein